MGELSPSARATLQAIVSALALTDHEAVALARLEEVAELVERPWPDILEDVHELLEAGAIRHELGVLFIWR